MKLEIIMVFLVLTGAAHCFEKNDCIKINRKNKNAGVIFRVFDKTEDNGYLLSSHAMVLDSSFIDTRKITKSQSKYFEKVECE